MLSLFVILMVMSMTFAGETPPEECVDCYQLPPVHDPYEPEGACCFGDHWVKCTTKDNCEVLGFVWAGPLTDANACKHLKPCCVPDGTCMDALCFDCIKMHGGKPIEDCADCVETLTTTLTTKTKHTKPPHTTHTTPETTPNLPDDGCCCLPDGSVPIMTSCDDCHTQGGIYRGDGKSCDIDNICLVKCCDTTTNTCVDGIESKDDCEAINGGVFHGVGECTESTCGGSCCIHGHAVIAYSEKECCERGGTFQGFGTPLDDSICPRACCLPGDIHRHCETMTVEDCVDNDGIPFNSGDTCHTIKCFGACCKDGEQSDTDSVQSQLSETYGPSTCEILDNSPQQSAQKSCEQDGGVYQGDGSQCPLLVLSDASDSTSDSTELSLDSPSSSTPSLNSDTSYVQDNGQCLNDGACCLRDKEQGDDGCVRTGTIALCVAMSGTFQGIGTRCSDSKICKKSACCLGSEGGCIDVHIGDNGFVECKLKGGRYVGDGTTCKLPGMCDKDSGACCCDGQCINMPNATTCYDYGGCSFRGTGTDCCHEGLCEDKNKDEGACCIQNSYLEDGAQCVVMPNAIACAFRGGVWRGKRTNCDNAEYTCGPLTGVCCVDGIAYDDQTASECKKCGGTFAGPGSSSGDEGVCDPTHRGACCKKMHGCSDTTYAQCKKQGGNFQGPGTCCNDRDICTPCEPCNTDAPKCSSDEDCPSESVCVAQFGKCMVPASRIKQKRIWNPLQHSRAMHLKVVPPAKPFVSARVSAEHHHNKDSTTSESSSDSDDGGWGKANHNDDDIPDGPFSCGSVNTIGRACVVHPCSGKCAIGVCGAPPSGTVSDGCESLCLRIHEYDCNCECRDPWWETCAFIAGATYNDIDSDNTLNIDVDELFTETPFNVNLFSVPSNGDDDVLVDTKTSTDGRFSFSGLPGGTYNVILQTPSGYRIEDGNGPAQQVTVTCLPPGDIPPVDIAKRNVLGNGVHSQVLTIVNGKTMSSHIKDNVYYLIAPGDAPEGIQGDQHVDGSPVVDALSSSSSAGVVIAIIIIGVIVVCLAVLVFGFLTSRRRRVYTTQQRIVQTNMRR